MILLDTHVLIWWVQGDHERLSTEARRAIESESESASEAGRILVSAISAWEVAQLVERGRLGLAMDVVRWIALLSGVPAVQFVRVDEKIAVSSVSLPGSFHKDPADRIIVATARHLSIPLVTADARILAYGHVRVIPA